MTRTPRGRQAAGAADQEHFPAQETPAPGGAPGRAVVELELAGELAERSAPVPVFPNLLPEASLTAWGSYLRERADQLWLSDWRFVLVGSPADPDALAQIHHTPGRKIGVIALGEGWEELDPAEQRHAILHELTHCHFKHVRELIYKLEDHLSPQAWELFFAAYSDAEEYAVDAISGAFAQFMPCFGQEQTGEAGD